MTNAFRAAAVSALVFPGAGLFLFRRYGRGLIFALPALLIVVMLSKSLLTAAAELSKQLAINALPLDVVYISEKLHAAIYTSPYWDQGKWVLLASWLLSILSSYFVGRKIDLNCPLAPQD